MGYHSWGHLAFIESPLPVTLKQSWRVALIILYQLVFKEISLTFWFCFLFCLNEVRVGISKTEL